MNFEVEDVNNSRQSAPKEEIAALESPVVVSGAMSPEKLQQIIDAIRNHPAQHVVLNTVGGGFTEAELAEIERVRGEIETATGKTVEVVNTADANEIFERLQSILEGLGKMSPTSASDTYPMSKEAGKKALEEFADAIAEATNGPRKGESLAQTIATYVTSILCGLDSEGRNANSVMDGLSGHLAQAIDNSLVSLAEIYHWDERTTEQVRALLRWSMGAMAAVITRAQHFAIEESKAAAAGE